ncbi:MAG: DUF1127 domain-containing protein [Pseudomonadota bacterium]
MNKYAMSLPVTGYRMPLVSIFDVLGVMSERRRLAQLSDRELEDIGLDRAAALREAGRPFWDLPRR